MKKLIQQAAAGMLLVIPALAIAADDGYRIAGIIALGAEDGEVIVELPDGDQRLLTKGDFLGQIEVMEISANAVLLRFPDGVRQLQLSQGDYIPFSPAGTGPADTGMAGRQNGNNRAQGNTAGRPRSQHGTPAESASAGVSNVTAVSAVPAASSSDGAGVVAGDFSKMLGKRVAPGLLASVRGLEILDKLSDSARIVSYAYLDQPEAGKVPVDSLDEGVNALGEAMAAGREVRVTVEGDEAFTDFYVMPAPPAGNP